MATVPTVAGWTTLEKIAGEVPGFVRGGRITDAQIVVWGESIEQQINAVMRRRGLSLVAADWSDVSGADLLGMINRLGAAAQLSAAVAAQFGGGEWGLTKAVERRFEREIKALGDGDYDKLFRPGAATVESGTLFGGGDMTDEEGEVERSFEKGQVL